MDTMLDERLSMLSALTPACRMAADVGADHGFLGTALLQSGKCECVQFLDISEKSLAKARRLVRKLSLAERARFSVGDGLSALTEPADAVIIAGMGGATIAGIVERGRTLVGDATLILQPNVEARTLRLRLSALGLRIVDESIARAEGRYYVGIVARSGWASYSREELLVGPCLIERGHPLLPGYAAFRMRVLDKAYRGAAAGHDAARAEELSGLLEEWRAVARRLHPDGRVAREECE